MHVIPESTALDAVNLLELEGAARESLHASYFDYYASGANDEITLRENIQAFQRVRLCPSVLVDVSQRDMSTTVLGRPMQLPVLVAPMAFQRLANPDGELATARAASAAGFGMVLSTFSTSPVADVRASTSGPLWFQLYVYRDRGATKALVEFAEHAGCEALAFTVDAPLIGRRERDVRNRMQLPEGLRVANALPGASAELTAEFSDSGLARYVMQMIDPALKWSDIEWLQSITRLPILVKGVQRGDDAARAVEHGVAGLVVSNHGGRQLDTARATLDALPEVVQAVDGRVDILLDGGVRRGTDVIKAVAMGAKAVLVGRPVLWGLAVAGEAGVKRVLDMLRDEIDLAMALCGCPTIGSVSAGLIARNGE